MKMSIYYNVSDCGSSGGFFHFQLSGLIELIHLLRSQAGLRHHVAAVLGEAVIELIIVADADHVADLIPEIVGVQAIAALGFLNII